MDKIDDFLKEKIKNEKENFNLPKSFENTIEQTLNNLDSKKIDKKWYGNKKILAMVACFAFILIIGFNFKNININNSTNVKVASEDQMLRDGAVQNGSGAEAYGLNNSRAKIESNGIKSLTIKYIDKDTKFKNVNNNEDILKVINYLSSLEIVPSNESIGVDWDFLIQVNGSVNSSIIIKDNIMNVNDEVYKIVNWNKNDLISLYNSLEYEEKYIKYCPTE